MFAYNRISFLLYLYNINLYNTKYIAGKTVWEKYKNLKSILLNHCNPHFTYKSGDNLEDALNRCKVQLLLYKQNKTINAKNKRNKAQDETYEEEPEVILSDIDASTFTPEHLVFCGHHDRSIFSVARCAKSHTYSDSDDEGNILCNNDDAHDTASTSTSKTTEKENRSNVSVVTQFASRKKQKLDAKNASKYNVSCSKNEESVAKNEMLKMQSEAHRVVGNSQVLKTNMEFMRLAVEFNLPNLEEI